jgi:hypothetical protein
VDLSIDPAFQFDMNPDPAFYFDAVPDPTYLFDADPASDFFMRILSSSKDANLQHWPTDVHVSRVNLHGSILSLHSFRFQG